MAKAASLYGVKCRTAVCIHAISFYVSCRRWRITSLFGCILSGGIGGRDILGPLRSVPYALPVISAREGRQGGGRRMSRT